MMGALGRWFRSSWITRGADGDGTAPLEAVAWRLFALAVLAVCVTVTFTTHPYPRPHGRDAVVLGSFLGLVVPAIVAHPGRTNVSNRQLVLALLGVIVAAGVLGAAQPHGIWIVGPY